MRDAGDLNRRMRLREILYSAARKKSCWLGSHPNRQANSPVTKSGCSLTNRLPRGIPASGGVRLNKESKRRRLIFRPFDLMLASAPLIPVRHTYILQPSILDWWSHHWGAKNVCWQDNKPGKCIPVMLGFRGGGSVQLPLSPEGRKSRLPLSIPDSQLRPVR